MKGDHQTFSLTDLAPDFGDAKHSLIASLPVADRGQVDGGLGTARANGTVLLIASNDLIKQAYEASTHRWRRK